MKRRSSSIQLYASDNGGVSFDFYSEIYHDPFERTYASYPHIVPVSENSWLCFIGCWFLDRNRWTALMSSEDEGLNWSQPRIINSWSVSLYPHLLRDGRLIVLFVRRCPDPTGLYAIVSEDNGQPWSHPILLRDDLPSAGPMGEVDAGYPVAVQLDDERVLVAYYWQHDEADVSWYGGRKFIAETVFHI